MTPEIFFEYLGRITAIFVLSLLCFSLVKKSYRRILLYWADSCREEYKECVMSSLIMIDKHCAHEYPEVAQACSFLLSRNRDRMYFHGEHESLLEALRVTYPRKQKDD